MKTVIILCELSTLKCDKFEFAKFLSQYSDEISNINDYVWLVKDYHEPTTPFEPDITNIINDLELQGYATKESNCVSIFPDIVSGRFSEFSDFIISK